ncbi:MAG: oligosaccharide flippase family protein [Beijerinckiaceae bacterium]
MSPAEAQLWRAAAMQGRFVRNSIFSAVAGITTALGGFISMVLVARLVGVEGTGIVSYALWIALVSVTIAELGFFATLTRYLPELKARGDSAEADHLVRRLLNYAAAATATLCLAFTGFGGWLWLHQPSQPATVWQAAPAIWVLVAVLVALQGAANFATGYLRGMQQFDHVARLAVFGSGLQIAGVITGSFGGYLGALAGYAAGSALQAAALLSTRRLPAGPVADALAARVRRFAGFAWVGSIASTIVWTRLELFFLERSFGAAAVGLYAVALTFANLASQGPMLLTGAMLPFFSEHFGRDHDAEARLHAEKILASGTRVIAFLAFPACLGLAAITPSLLPMVYGAGFAGATPAAIITLVAAAIGAAGSVGSHLIYGNDRSDVILYVNAIGAVLLIVAGLTAIPAFGVEGAAWSRAVVHTLLVGMGIWFITQRIGFKMPVAGLFRLFTAAALAALPAAFIAYHVAGVVGICVALAATALTYPLATRLLRGLAPQDAEYLAAVARKAPPFMARAAEVTVRWIARAERT